MSFLNQLKSQASALQSAQGAQQQDLEKNIRATEEACRAVQHYLLDLARQLNVIGPAGPKMSLDGKQPWPASKLSDFRVDARKKSFSGAEVFDYIAIGWRVLPQPGQPTQGSVTVNFPPELERVESRLASGMVKHERKEQRHPEKNTLQAIRFDYVAETRGTITVTPDHARAVLAFRLSNVDGFGVLKSEWPAAQVKSDTLDELAKLVVSQPSRFA